MLLFHFSLSPSLPPSLSHSLPLSIPLHPSFPFLSLSLFFGEAVETAILDLQYTNVYTPLSTEWSMVASLKSLLIVHVFYYHLDLVLNLWDFMNLISAFPVVY